MCYSKEVSLLTATTIATGSGYSYWRYYLTVQIEAAREKLKPFFLYIAVGFFCVGVHQFFEFLSIATGSQIIYKIGLIASITTMYFFIRALELLSDRVLGSRWAALLIFLLAVSILTRPMYFANEHFWVRGYSHGVWAATWLFLFLYFNVAIIYLYQQLHSKTDRRLFTIFPFAVINMSFILAAILSFAAALVQHSPALTNVASHLGVANVLLSFQSVQDYPSVWCALSASQAITIPIFFGKMTDRFEMKELERVPKTTATVLLQLVGISLGVWLVFFYGIPLLSGVALKLFTN